ncbi:unnamed protein product [Ambrosiozyma monospora]|uniref:Unnamed protein product n=1 Tax=Ambrosiozyma monospora TaxID=43982 RepID=A0ACB5SVS9_AMBMO|nr:unnamed protein product [Ambrosiozyma monospora]
MTFLKVLYYTQEIMEFLIHKNIIETSINSGDPHSTTQINLKLRKVHRITLSNKDLKGLYDDVKPQICKILYELNALELHSIDKSNHGGGGLKSSRSRSRQSRSQEKQRKVNKDNSPGDDDDVKMLGGKEDHGSSSSDDEMDQEQADGSHQTGEKILKLPLITENWKCYLMITMEEVMAIRSIIRNNSDSIGAMELAGHKSKLVYNSVLVRDLVFRRRNTKKKTNGDPEKANEINLVDDEEDGLFVGDFDAGEEEAMKKSFRVRYKSKHVLPISLNVHVYSKN